MMNKVILVGNVGADPVVRTFPDGNKYANFSLATTEFWKSAQGEKKDKTEWHRVVVQVSKLAEIVEMRVKKGSRLLVEGSIQNRKYQDTNGIERNIVEIVVRFGGTIKILSNGIGSSGDDMSSDGDSYSGSSEDTDMASPIVDDDIPF